MNRWILVALLATLGLSACSKKEEPAAAAPAGHPAMSAALPNQGKVTQVQSGGGYTYTEVEGPNGQKVWIAGAQINIKPGDTVQWGDYAVMNNFTAKSLGRTFDQILFVNAWAPAGAAPVQVSPHGTMPGGQAMQTASPHGAMTSAPGAGNSGVVKSVVNAGGYSYLEVNQGNGTLWVAAPETAVKAGDKVTWEGGSLMQNFTAKSLNRTFDQIVFAGGVTVAR